MGHFRADLKKYYRIECGTDNPPLRRKLKLWSLNLGLHCVAVYRLGRYARAGVARGNWLFLPLLILFEILAFLVRFIHHVDIFAASIGPGFYIGHVGTIYLGRCVVGANLSVTHNVTLGVGVSGQVHGLPVLGDDIWIGTGSVLYGNIRVGSGVTVNCGSVLSRSIPERCLVGGNPARIILRNHENTALFGIAALPEPAATSLPEFAAKETSAPEGAVPADSPDAESVPATFPRPAAAADLISAAST